MKLIEFGSRYTFRDWFSRKDRSTNYPLIENNYLYCWEEDTHIYRAVENGKDIGIIFLSCIYPGSMWIDLFEIRDGYHRKGLGTEMFRLLMEKHRPNYIQLQCVEECGRNKEAHRFWWKMGFRRDCSIYDEVMVKIIKKKYWKDYDKLS